MAIQEHLDILKSGVVNWNKWRKENLGVRPGLVNANLANANLANANLAGADLHGANLIDADLAGADLSSANLIDADLSHANLRKADLSHANLRKANLSSANLSSANLINADLTNANLTNSNLSNSFLWSTNFNRCDLTGTKLNGSSLMSVSFSNVDLSDASLGLESLEHRSPSLIDVSTFYKSRARIPEEFLRKAGIRKNFIRYIKSLVESEDVMAFYSCFISYSQKDKKFAAKLYDNLINHDVNCFLDEKSIEIGDDIHLEIDRGIKQQDKVILICSENSLNSWWVDDEIEKTLEKERKDHKEKKLALVPIRIDDYVFDRWENPKKNQILKRKIGDFRDWKDTESFEKEARNLIDAIRTDRKLLKLKPKRKKDM